jgi:hypothetical protein
MSVFGMIASAGVAALTLWGIYIGFRGALAEHPPYMQGQGAKARFDARVRRAA